MRGAPWLAALALVFAASAGAEEKRAFEIMEVPSPGRTAAAGFADLDGDGRVDVFSVALSGVPPETRRELRVYYQTPEGSFPGIPDWSGEPLAGAAAWDVADLADGPGQELLLLHRRGVAVLSFAGRRLARREIPFPEGPTLAFAPDERGLDRLRIARTEFPDGPLLLVPGLGECAVMRPDGTLLGFLEVGHRANYFIPPRPGPMVGESDIEQFYDYPHLEVGDVNGDGRLDLIATTRHELRVFLRGADGRFGEKPSPRLLLGRLTEDDMIRSGSANVRMSLAHFDDDGRIDLMMSHISGGFLDARTETTFHLNRDGRWALEAPDQRFVVEGRWNSWQLLDLDGDARAELLEGQIRLSVLELVEVLVTRAIDAELLIRKPGGPEVFVAKPWVKRKLSLPLSFETFEPKGFIPTFEADVNGDGFRDRLGSGGGKAIEVSLGGSKKPWSKRAVRQELDTTGNLRFGDLDSDGLTDFMIYDRTRPGTPLRIGRNLGVLPGVRKKLELRAREEGY